ncbi:MAG: penicillin-binding protein 2 [bacterium]|nr:penicillin-binding protein 2 [bacterium]
MYRLRLLFAFFILLIGLVWARLFYWQVYSGSKISVLAASQHIGRFDVNAKRGEFFTHDGYPLVLNAISYRVVADPYSIADPIDTISEKFADIVISDEERRRNKAMQIVHEATAATNAATYILSDDQIKLKKIDETKRLSEHLNKKELRWAQLYSHVSPELKEKLEQLKYKGISFENTFARMYPEASLSGTFAGILGSDVNGEAQGSYGLEGKYDGELSGKSGLVRQEQDALGRMILVGDYRNITARHGSDLQLSIDRTVQHIVQEKLREGITKYGAKDGSIVVMDPKTGGILAMASYPSIDPDLREFFPNTWYRNPVVADTYEPGSTFKTLVMAAGIDAGVISFNTTCPVCAGPRKVEQYLIRTWNNEYMQNPTMEDVLVHSDNTGMVFIGEKLGKERLQTYLKNFGFGQPTGVDLQDETGSLLREAINMRDIDFATETFGQGIAVTAMQMVRAVGAIANKGNLMEPHVVEKIKRDTETVEIKPKVVRRVISEQTAMTMTDIMVKSAEHGEAKFAMAALHGYRIAGKTGTAQIPIDGQYDASKTIASFVGFAPADEPKFVMLVRLTEPKSSQWGSETAAPLFFDVAKELLRYYSISPQ